MPDTYDYITLLCRLKAAQTRIKELESGERYIHLQELHQKEYMAYERKLRRLTQDLAAAHRETIRVRNYWFQVLEDMQRELEQAKRKAEQELKKMEKRALDAEKQRDDALDKAKEIRLQYYETAAEHRSIVTMKTPLFLPLSRSNGKRSQTAGKKQDGNRAVSRGIPATAEKNRNPHSRLSFFLHRKKSWKTVISKRPAERS